MIMFQVAFQTQLISVILYINEQLYRCSYVHNEVFQNYASLKTEINYDHIESQEFINHVSIFKQTASPIISFSFDLTISLSNIHVFSLISQLEHDNIEIKDTTLNLTISSSIVQTIYGLTFMSLDDVAGLDITRFNFNLTLQESQIGDLCVVTSSINSLIIKNSLLKVITTNISNYHGLAQFLSNLILMSSIINIEGEGLIINGLTKELDTSSSIHNLTIEISVKSNNQFQLIQKVGGQIFWKDSKLVGQTQTKSYYGLCETLKGQIIIQGFDYIIKAITEYASGLANIVETGAVLNATNLYLQGYIDDDYRHQSHAFISQNNGEISIQCKDNSHIGGAWNSFTNNADDDTNIIGVNLNALNFDVQSFNDQIKGVSDKYILNTQIMNYNNTAIHTDNVSLTIEGKFALFSQTTIFHNISITTGIIMNGESGTHLAVFQNTVQKETILKNIVLQANLSIQKIDGCVALFTNSQAALINVTNLTIKNTIITAPKIASLFINYQNAFMNLSFVTAENSTFVENVDDHLGGFVTISQNTIQLQNCHISISVTQTNLLRGIFKSSVFCVGSKVGSQYIPGENVTIVARGVFNEVTSANGDSVLNTTWNNVQQLKFIDIEIKLKQNVDIAFNDNPETFYNYNCFEDTGNYNSTFIAFQDFSQLTADKAIVSPFYNHPIFYNISITGKISTNFGQYGTAALITAFQTTKIQIGFCTTKGFITGRKTHISGFVAFSQAEIIITNSLVNTTLVCELCSAAENFAVGSFIAFMKTKTSVHVDYSRAEVYIVSSWIAGTMIGVLNANETQFSNSVSYSSMTANSVVSGTLIGKTVATDPKFSNCSSQVCGTINKCSIGQSNNILTPCSFFRLVVQVTDFLPSQTKTSKVQSQSTSIQSRYFFNGSNYDYNNSALVYKLGSNTGQSYTFFNDQPSYFNIKLQNEGSYIEEGTSSNILSMAGLTTVNEIACIITNVSVQLIFTGKNNVYFGGLITYAKNNVVISKSEITGSFTGIHAGGFITFADNSCVCSIQNSNFIGSVTGTSYTAGFVVELRGQSKLQVSGCAIVSGSTISGKYRIGGIVASVWQTCSVDIRTTKFQNGARVYGNSFTGGFIGYVDSQVYLYFSANVLHGTIYANMSLQAGSVIAYTNSKINYGDTTESWTNGQFCSCPINFDSPNQIYNGFHCKKNEAWINKDNHGIRCSYSENYYSTGLRDHCYFVTTGENFNNTIINVWYDSYGSWAKWKHTVALFDNGFNYFENVLLQGSVKYATNTDNGLDILRTSGFLSFAANQHVIFIKCENYYNVDADNSANYGAYIGSVGYVMYASSPVTFYSCYGNFKWEPGFCNFWMKNVGFSSQFVGYIINSGSVVFKNCQAQYRSSRCDREIETISFVFQANWKLCNMVNNYGNHGRMVTYNAHSYGLRDGGCLCKYGEWCYKAN